MTRNISIDALRVIATILVILLHISGGYVVSIGDEEYNFNFWTANLIDSFSRICVPLFVLISGRYLLDKKEPIQDFYKKRVQRILLPLIFATVIYSFYQFIGIYYVTGKFNFNTIANNIILGKPYYHLWYLYMLLGLYLITPILREIKEKLTLKQCYTLSIGLIIFGMILDTYDSVLGNKTFFMLWSLKYLGYFFLGYLLKDLRYFSVLSLSLIYIISSIATAIATYFTLSYFNSLYFYNYLSPFVIISSLAFYQIFSQINLKNVLFEKLAPLTLGIYIIHAGVLSVLVKIFEKYPLQISTNIIIEIIIKFSIVFSISMIISYLFSKNRILRKLI
ncbi:surface polysaccharide O-acyltransferase-like enzyme [Bisgaardia hudsonensis]|uniref:Surface polysaccharide O-acyltransferase-like enzyme n=1 Tax=Bisgaardia hudsonensis TaxID=109472 RepID=A0A4R2N301_9PAST|nr:acyltransferase family protein [Bisgaardia hudsonensis]QLB12703.1 hypothetical protein A6A11_03325 [Bisgaardia hudsonensis]TCP14251.1 surface polysaccharide O-acyltransferase-like enzyme [Bisgaardia hudsonensis]